MTTYTPKKGAHSKAWIEINADGIVLGRLAAFIASRLRGKHLSHYAPHADLGDNIVVTNAHKVALTGKKLQDKIYYRHSGYPGGISSRTADEILNGKNPQELLRLAVKRMLPYGALARQQLSNLKIYCESEHPHTAQKPEVIDLASLNSHNTPRS